MGLFDNIGVEKKVVLVDSLIGLAVALARLFNVLATDIEKDNKTTTMHKEVKK